MQPVSGGRAGEITSVAVQLRVNGRDYALGLDPRTTLLDALRERLHLTGSKKGCDQGQCDARTVIANGRRINRCLTLAVMHEGDDIVIIEGLGTPDALHPMQKAFRARRLPVWLLHARSAPVGNCRARGDSRRDPKPCHGRSDRSDPAQRAGDPRTDERKSLPLCRLSEHHCGDPRGNGRTMMKAFTYERVETPAETAAAVARTPGAKFIAGGTNLLDLMKLEIETPAHLVDVNRLGLSTIEETEDRGLRIGALVRNTDLAADVRGRRDYDVLSRAIVAGASGQLCN
jgi:xanthine dehydrogenase iron-sulfur cluster and FAD-binding subunit A